MEFYFVSPLVLIPTSCDTLEPIRSDFLRCSKMDPRVILEVSLIAGFVRAISAVVEFLASPLVLVTEALSSKPHEPITDPDGRADVDILHVSILRCFAFEGFVTHFALKPLLMDLHVPLQQLRRFENFATLLTWMRLAVDLLYMSLHHPLVRAGVVTLLLVLALVNLAFRALLGVISQFLLKQIAITI